MGGAWGAMHNQNQKYSLHYKCILIQEDYMLLYKTEGKDDWK